MLRTSAGGILSIIIMRMDIYCLSVCFIIREPAAHSNSVCGIPSHETSARTSTYVSAIFGGSFEQNIIFHTLDTHFGHVLPFLASCARVGNFRECENRKYDFYQTAGHKLQQEEDA